MYDIAQKTGGCIKFTQRTYEQNYIKFHKGVGCNSYVGRVGGGQLVSIGENCDHLGIIVHEINHALGFFHEHTRPDRDNHLTIFWNNIQNGMATQFQKLHPTQTKLLNSFDVKSVMLYGDTAFSKDGVSKTMIAKSNKKLREVHEKTGLSASDVYRIKKLYKC
ncbi:astacin-like metalloprotease toxin 1 [Centruroides vittatus]|uniref:astacin-like metalloprotease toxin 1 n=1 Tax=Centruroides vittatus TaxID=120091 RepID=UPI003510554F